MLLYQARGRHWSAVVDGKTEQKIVARARIVLLSGREFARIASARGSGIEADVALAESHMDGGVERLLKDRGKGARPERSDQCRCGSRS